ncbi:hypothetical protein QUB53_29060 [Microcoleus sp. AT8-B4]
MSVEKPKGPANDDELCEGSERAQAELRGLLDQTQFLLRRAQQVIDRTRGRRASEGAEKA